MNRLTPIRLLSTGLLIVSLGLCGCGNKGPLKHPSPNNTAAITN